MAVDWKEVIAGTVAGVAVIIVKHPSDTIKTLLQLGKKSGSKMGPMVKHTFNTAGWRGFFRGIAGPLLTVPLLNAVVFGAYARRWFGHSDPNELTLKQLAMCGAWAGFINCIVVGPIELVKTQMQQQLTAPNLSKLYKNSFDCALDIVKTHGPKPLLRGMVATILREIPAYTAQFFVFEGLIRWFRRSESRVNDTVGVLIAGGIACWVASYPPDVIKSNIQADLIGTQWRSTGLFFDGGVIQCARYIYKTNGFRGFWLGIAPCLIGVIPGNAALFFAYDTTMRYLKKLDE